MELHESERNTTTTLRNTHADSEPTPSGARMDRVENPILSAFKQKQRSISDRISINPKDLYSLDNYRNIFNRLSMILIVLIFPTYLMDSLLLASTFIPYLVVILLLLITLCLYLITSNIVTVFLSDIILPLAAQEKANRLSRGIFVVLFVISLTTTSYTEPGYGIFLELSTRLELTVLMTLLIYLKSIARQKSLIVYQQCQLTRLPIELLSIYLDEEKNEDTMSTIDSLASAPLFFQITVEQRQKKNMLQHNAYVMRFLRYVLTVDLWLSFIISGLLVFLGLYNVHYFLDYIAFIVFIYSVSIIPVVFSIFHITEINENIELMESDLKVITNYQVRLFSWIPKKELFVGVVVTLSINAIKIFLV